MATQTELLNPAGEALRRAGRQIFYQRTVAFRGVDRLQESGLAALLPGNRSNLWWAFNPAEVEDALRRNPLIAEVNSKRCAWYTLRCFEISVTERDARMIAVEDDGDHAWVVGGDGAFIAPFLLSEHQPKPTREISGVPATPPVVRGVWSPIKASEEVSAKARLLIRGLDGFEAGAELPVSEVRLTAEGEVVAKVSSVRAPVVIAALEASRHEFYDKGLRLKSLISQLGARLDEATAIDLAYSKLGVVRFPSPPVKTGTSGKSKG